VNNQIQQYQDAGNALTIGNENGLVQAAETISSVLAAQAEAEVKARYIVAMQRPRNIERVRQALKAECERPGFAGVAFYRLPPRSKKRDAKPIQGLSIRFAESAFRAMGNLDMRAFVTYEDDDMRMVRATVIDIESNAAISTDIPIKKTIERRYLKEGEIAISQRLNSDGHVVYLRRATDDEITPKQNSAISKAFRNGVLRLLPGDIQDECERRILQIRNGDVPKDPKEQVRKIIDSFGSIGVDADDLVKYLGHKVETCSPSELQNLRDLFGSIRAGETNFHDEMRSVEVSDDKADSAPKSKPERLKDQLREKSEVIPADPPEILEIKTDCTDMAHAIWGDDGMKRISEICRGADRDCQYGDGFQKFMFSAATEEQLQWLRDELSQRS
jgi:hypothetical protein